MDQLPRLGKRELICLLLFTCNYVVSVWSGFLFLWVLGMGYVILLWHYEGGGGVIYNGNVPINRKVLYLYALLLHFQNDMLLNYTTAKSQLSSLFLTLHSPLLR